MRDQPLIRRKARLREVVPPQPSRLHYVEHVAERGIDFYGAACAMDLEGVVAKIAGAPYGTEPSTWTKIKNPHYTQGIGRRELLERRKAKGA